MALRTSSIEPNWAIFTPCLPNARRAATRMSGLRSNSTTLRYVASGDSTSIRPPETLNCPERGGAPVPGSGGSSGTFATGAGGSTAFATAGAAAGAAGFHASGNGSSSGTGAKGSFSSRSSGVGNGTTLSVGDDDVPGRRVETGGSSGCPSPRLSEAGVVSAGAEPRSSAFPAFSDSSSPRSGLIFSPSAEPRILDGGKPPSLNSTSGSYSTSSGLTESLRMKLNSPSREWRSGETTERMRARMASPSASFVIRFISSTAVPYGIPLSSICRSRTSDCWLTAPVATRYDTRSGLSGDEALAISP